MATVKALLVAVVVCTTWYRTDAACSFQRCEDYSSGALYEPGDEWTERYENYCSKCKCSEDDYYSYGMSAQCCRTSYATDIPDHCTDIFDSINCVHYVVEKSDLNKQCTGSYTEVGK